VVEDAEEVVVAEAGAGEGDDDTGRRTTSRSTSTSKVTTTTSSAHKKLSISVFKKLFSLVYSNTSSTRAVRSLDAHNLRNVGMLLPYEY